MEKVQHIQLAETDGFGLVHQRNCNHDWIVSRSSWFQMDRAIGTEMKKDVAQRLDIEDVCQEKARLVAAVASYLSEELNLVEHFDSVLLPNSNTHPLV